jgi:hypothetical protein
MLRNALSQVGCDVAGRALKFLRQRHRTIGLIVAEFRILTRPDRLNQFGEFLRAEPVAGHRLEGVAKLITKFVEDVHSPKE